MVVFFCSSMPAAGLCFDLHAQAGAQAWTHARARASSAHAGDARAGAAPAVCGHARPDPLNMPDAPARATDSRAGPQAQQVLLELQAAVMAAGGLADRQRSAVCTALAVADKDLVDGADEHLQLLNVAAALQRTLCSA